MKTVKQCITYAYKYCRPAELTGVTGVHMEPWTTSAPLNEREPWANSYITVKSTTRAGCTNIINRYRFAVALWCWYDNWENTNGVDAAEIREIITSACQEAAFFWSWNWIKALRDAINSLKAYEGCAE